MSFLDIQNISLQMGDFKLKDINMSIPEGKVLVILGPSGSGKSMLLETVAGFYKPQGGRMLLNQEDITELPPEKRGIGFMFQDHALFPHMTVRKNIMFPLRFDGRDAKEKAIDMEKILSMLHIEKLQERYPGNLSGGEKQRVALARALMRNPKLFLFDEPMSALDARTKEELREDLGRLLKELGLTSIYVTHDQEEALALADILSIIDKGRIIQCDTKENVFNHPATPFAAQFVGMENLFDAKVLSVDREGCEGFRCTLEIQGYGTLIASGSYEVNPGDKVTVGIRPEDIMLEPFERGKDGCLTSLPCENIIIGSVKTIISKGAIYKLCLSGKAELRVLLAKQQLNSGGYAEGSSVKAGLPPGALRLIKKTE